MKQKDLALIWWKAFSGSKLAGFTTADSLRSADVSVEIEKFRISPERKQDDNTI
jgi:hypothetical protein